MLTVGHRDERGDRWWWVVGVAAFVAFQLRVATFAGAAAMWRYTHGSFWETFVPEITYFVFVLIVLPVSAVTLAHRPPTLRAPLRSAALFLLLAGGGVVLHHLIFFELMVRIDGYAPDRARAILLRAGPRMFHALLVLLLLLTLVILARRSEQARAAQERKRSELERALAFRAADAIRRNAHPELLARSLSRLAATIVNHGDAELLIHRIARYLRLLQHDKGPSVRLLTEMNLLASLERLSSFRFSIELPEQLRDVRVVKGLAAAFADLTKHVDGERRILVAALRKGDVVRVIVGSNTRGDRCLALLRRQLEDDYEFAQSATISQCGADLLIDYIPQSADVPDVVVDETDSKSRRRRARVGIWLPAAIVLIVSTRVRFVPTPYEIMNIARDLIGLLWLGAAPFLGAAIGRLRGTFFTMLTAATGLATLASAGLSLVALHAASMLTGLDVIVPAGEGPWLTLPRDSGTIGTAVAVSALLVHIIRRNAEEQTRGVQLEALLARADIGALQASLHPHFLFNSLHAVLALLREDRRAAYLMVARLAALFEDVLQSGAAQEWTLREEREFLRKYLEVMRVRLGERLRVVWRIPRLFDTLCVPRFVLQPLVENAVEHGIAPRLAAGTIVLTAAWKGMTRWRISVENDTPGTATPPRVRRGGLTYATERLELLYGIGSVPKFSAAGERFRAEITLPYRPWATSSRRRR